MRPLSRLALAVPLLTALAAAAQKPAPKALVPTSQEAGQEWRYTFEAPAGAWTSPEFDDEKWAKGPGGFGTQGTPGAVVRTEWKTPDIWIRRTVELPEVKDRAKVRLAIHHDEDAEVYINGVLAARAVGYITAYRVRWMSPEAVRALRPGKNVLAVHCRQTGGGQYIDVGLVLDGE